MRKVFLSTEYGRPNGPKKASLEEASFDDTAAVLEFPDSSQAKHFAEHWQSTMHDYKEACPAGHYKVDILVPFNGKWVRDDFYVNK